MLFSDTYVILEDLGEGTLLMLEQLHDGSVLELALQLGWHLDGMRMKIVLGVDGHVELLHQQLVDEEVGVVEDLVLVALLHFVAHRIPIMVVVC